VISFAANLVRIVIVLLVVRLVLRFVAAVVQGYQGAPRREAATDMVRDRVCDTFLPRARALVAVVNGREEHFCSAKCRDRARRLITT
jgi:hypothetical protein